MTWLIKAARFGYAAKGVTYMLIGVLALEASFGGGSAESTHGALRSVDGPNGSGILLLAIGAGLASYAFWKLYLAVADPQRRGWGARSTALFVAFTNAGFASEAFRLALSLGAPPNQGDPAVHWSAIVMSHRAGVFAVGLAGALVAAYGLSQFVRAVRPKVEEHLRRLHLAPDTKRWVVQACRFGIAARGLVFVLLGWFLVRASFETNPNEAKDFGRTLNELRTQPLGRSALTVVAVGLMLYAVYQFLRAKYERFAA